MAFLRASLRCVLLLLLVCTQPCISQISDGSLSAPYVLSNKAITASCSVNGLIKMETSTGDSVDIVGDGLSCTAV